MLFGSDPSLPLYTQVTLGVGAPTARQMIVASFPSKTVTFFGGCSSTGFEALREDQKKCFNKNPKQLFHFHSHKLCNLFYFKLVVL